MPERGKTTSAYVKTSDLAGRQQRGWVFCAECYGNVVDERHNTTGADGETCKRCDGSGTLWIVDPPSDSEAPS